MKKLFLIVFFLFCLSPVFCLASDSYISDFDSFTLGDLNGQDSWQTAVNSASCVVVDDYSHSASNSVKCGVSGGGAGGWGNTRAITGSNMGEAYIWVRWDDNSNDGITSFHIGFEDGTAQMDIRYRSWIPDLVFQQGYGTSVGYTSGWHRLGIKWENSAFWGNIDGGEWQDGFVTGSISGAPVSVYFGGNNGYSGYSRFDDILIVDNSTPEPVEGESPMITATFPVNGEENHAGDITNFNVSGNISIPTAHIFSYDWICINFKNVEDETENWTKCEEIDPAVAPGADYDYNFYVDTIPHDKYFSVWYMLIGHNASTGEYNSYYYTPENTYLTENTSPPASVFNPINFDSWAFVEEDCESYDLLPKLVCQIKNMLGGVFLPTTTALTTAQQTFNQFKNKFPFNYISAFRDTLETVYDGVTQEGTSIQLTIFGNSQPVDLLWFADTEIGGILYSVLQFIFILVFVFWGINYLGRIF